MMYTAVGSHYLWSECTWKGDCATESSYDDGIVAITITLTSSGWYAESSSTSVRIYKEVSTYDAAREGPDRQYTLAMEHADRHAMLQRLRGAVMQGDRVRYWPMAAADVPPGPQVAGHRCMGYFAGCRDWTRGRHWDRRSRYGER